MSPAHIAPIVHVARQSRVGARHRSGVRRHRADDLRERGLAPRPVAREPARRRRRAGTEGVGAGRPGPPQRQHAGLRPEVGEQTRCRSTRMPSGPSPSPPAARGAARTRLVYALGVGAGAADPLDELEFTTENTSGKEQRVLPTIAVVLGPLGGALRRHRQLQPGDARPRRAGHHPAPGDPGRGRARGGERDHRHLRQGQGRGRGHRESRPRCVDTGEPLFDTRMSAYIRGEGGWGGDRGPSGNPNEAPGPRRPTTRSSCRPAPTRRCSTACRATATRCTTTRPSRPWAASTGRSSTACAPTASPVAALLHAAVRQRPGPLQGHGRPLLVAGHARRVAHREGVGRSATAAPCSRPSARTAASCIDAGRVTYTA